MKKTNGSLRYSPTDLTRFYKSPFASWMERLKLEHPEALIQLGAERDVEDPLMARLQSKGYDHEDALEAELRESSETVEKIVGKNNKEKFANTKAAMAEGCDVIVQGYLEKNNFGGYSDFLVKVDGASDLGSWHYEVWDTKLANKTNPAFIIQLCCYSDMLNDIQQRMPASVTVALGNGQRETYRVADYYDYYLNLQKIFLATQATFNPDEMPNPSDSYSWGDWSGFAGELLKRQDHLSLVAGLARGHVSKLEKAGIATMTELSTTEFEKSPGISQSVFERLKLQASLQVASAGNFIPDYVVNKYASGEKLGLALLPPASSQDVFFDIEGYPLMEGGLEYLWGATYFDDNNERQFRDFWAHTQDAEKIAFEAFIQWVYARWKADPSMHIYHYANYEIAACRKLMGRWGVCEEEVDQLLRNEVFVDLYKVVKSGLVVGEPRYSIKNIEHLYRNARDTEVSGGGESVVVYDQWRDAFERGEESDSWEKSDILNSIRDYNIDDCDSTQELAEWLRARQAEQNIAYIGKVDVYEPDITEEVTARTELRDKLLEQSAVLEESDASGSETLTMLAWLLEFHRRESKPIFWRLFDRLGSTEDDLLDDAECLAACVRTPLEPFKPTPRARNLAYEYTFDKDQEFKGGVSSYYLLGVEREDGRNEKVTALSAYCDYPNGKIVVQSKTEPPERISLVPDDYLNPAPIPAGIQRVAETVSADLSQHLAIVDFLKRDKPRLLDSVGGPIVTTSDSTVFMEETIDAVRRLDNSYLPIQGPPGSGKTYTATRVIAALLKTGAKIGITSNSHKAINNLLSSCAAYCHEQGVDASFSCAKNTGPEIEELGIDIVANGSIAESLNGACVVGTTAWGFSRADLDDQFDYLFIDEAGQVSVANLVAMSGCANNLVLLGDQMQLGQPIQGSHPGKSGLSILDYLMDGKATIDADRGIFLPLTYRMHSTITSFISDHFYDGKLKAVSSTDLRTIAVPMEYKGPLNKSAGILYCPVEHEGCTQGSDEEVSAITKLVDELIGRDFHNIDGNTRPLTLDDIMFVAPYNMQVNKLKEALGEQASVGSVDKFQGQEAPVVVLSLCASNASESPRGLDFLLGSQRMNVALSRAQSLAIVVASPQLSLSSASSVKQMKLINLFCSICAEE